MKKKILLTVSIALFFAVISACIYVFAFYLPQKRAKDEQMELVYEYYQNKLIKYQEENEKYDDYEIDVAFLGDSLTDGCDVEHYYPDYKVVNRGIGGETTHGLQKRMDVSLYDLKPKVAVILIGGNNLDTMFENYEDMLRDIREKLPNTQVILCSLTAMGGNWAEKNRIATYNNVIIEKLAEKYGCCFVDLYSPLFDLETGEICSDYTVEGVHLTPLGYEIITGVINPVIETVISDK